MKPDDLSSTLVLLEILGARYLREDLEYESKMEKKDD